MTQTASSFNFPRVEARKCSCCGQPLTTGFGFSVPYIGTVGPKCVHKFSALALALAQMDGLTVEAGTGALGRLRLSLVGLGYEARIHVEDDGRWTLEIGARTRTDADKVVQTWEKRRAEFIQELKAAGVQLEVPAEAPVPVLTEAAIAALSLPERRVVALEHGVLTPAGKASTSVALIWAAVQVAQLGEAEAVAMVEVEAPALTLTTPMFSDVALPYFTGPLEQVQQRHFAQLSVPTLPFYPPIPEEEVDALLEAGAARRLDFHIREVQARERGDGEECERLYRLQGVETRHMLALTAALEGPHAQVEQRQMTRVEGHVAMLAKYRFTRQDGGRIPPEQRTQLDEALFEVIGDFARAYHLNVEGLAMFDRGDGPQVATTYPEAECDRCGALLNADGGCPVCDQVPPHEDGFALRAKYGAWVLAQNGGQPPICGDCGKEVVPEEATQGPDERFYCGYCWGAICDEATGEPVEGDGPHVQEEQQQQTAVAVAVVDAPATCTSCGHERADPRQTCRCCQGAVCMRCAAYDEHGTLHCADCLAESLTDEDTEEDGEHSQ